MKRRVETLAGFLGGGDQRGGLGGRDRFSFRQCQGVTEDDGPVVAPEIEMAEPEAFVEPGDQLAHVLVAPVGRLQLQAGADMDHVQVRPVGEPDLVVAPGARGGQVQFQLVALIGILFGDDGLLDALERVHNRHVLLGAELHKVLSPCRRATHHPHVVDGTPRFPRSATAVMVS